MEPSSPTYTAYGLTISSDTPLPGLTDAEGPGKGRSVAVRATTPEALRQRWASQPSEPAWRARIGSSGVLDVTRDPQGTHRFELDGTARYEASADGRLALVAGGPDEVLREFCDSVLAWSALVQGAEGLHASAVTVGNGAVALIGPSGHGKTTLAVAMLRQGSALVADDLVMVEPSAIGFAAWPGTRLMNVPRVELDGPGQEWVEQRLATFSSEAWVSCARVATGPLPLAAVVLIERGEGSEPSIEPTQLTVLDLLGHALGVRGLPERQLQRFERFGDLAESVPGWRLRVPTGPGPDATARLIRSSLES